MKKFLITALALVASVSMSIAGMGIIWSDGGWMAEYGGNVSDGPGIAESSDVLWQLIYAGEDNVANDPQLDAVNYLGGDDSLLAAREIPSGGGDASDGTAWDSWLQYQSGSVLYEDLDWSGDGKYVYQRIWQGTPSVDIENNYYYQTSLFEYTSTYAGGGASPDTFNYDKDGEGVVVDQVINGEGPGPQPTVPEPATMSLLGLGALAMVLRRKLSK